jgi:putative superfamily III holin-X
MEPMRSYRESNHRKESIIQLIRGICQDSFSLSSKELTAAKLEIKQEITKGVKAGISLGVGVFILAVGVILLSCMLVFILSAYTPIPLWGSFGIIGLIYAIAGGLLVWGAKEKASDVKPYPQDSVESAKEDVRYVSARAAGH